MNLKVNENYQENLFNIYIKKDYINLYYSMYHNIELELIYACNN